MNLESLQKQLALEEGCPERTYLDSKNILTGGIGHNLVDEPEPGFDRIGILVPPEMVTKWFLKDIQDAIDDLDRELPWWRNETDGRQNALLNLDFNMGWLGLSTFHNTLNAFKNGNYGAVASGIRYSQYAKEVGPTRSNRIMKMIETGELPIL